MREYDLERAQAVNSNHAIRIEETRGKEPDYASWTQERAEKQLKSVKKKYRNDWKNMLKAFSWADDPEAALSTLEKKATGKWPNEK